MPDTTTEFHTVRCAACRALVYGADGDVCEDCDRKARAAGYVPAAEVERLRAAIERHRLAMDDQPKPPLALDRELWAVLDAEATPKKHVRVTTVATSRCAAPSERRLPLPDAPYTEIDIGERESLGRMYLVPHEDGVSLMFRYTDPDRLEEEMFLTTREALRFVGEVTTLMVSTGFLRLPEDSPKDTTTARNPGEEIIK